MLNKLAVQLAYALRTRQLLLTLALYARGTNGYMATPLLDLDSAASKLGISSLKDKQREAITSFVDGHDVFVSLATGYGKSLCYTLLPLVRPESQRCAVTAGMQSTLYYLFRCCTVSVQSALVHARPSDRSVTITLSVTYVLLTLRPQLKFLEHRNSIGCCPDSFLLCARKSGPETSAVTVPQASRSCVSNVTIWLCS